MAAATSKNNEAGKLIEVSLSEDDGQKYERRSQQVEWKSGQTEEVEGTKEREDSRLHCLRRRRRRIQIAEERDVSEERIRRGCEKWKIIFR